MLKKILKVLKYLSKGSSERRRYNYRRGSSSRRYKSYPLSGSHRYKRKGRSSS